MYQFLGSKLEIGFSKDPTLKEGITDWGGISKSKLIETISSKSVPLVGQDESTFKLNTLTNDPCLNNRFVIKTSDVENTKPDFFTEIELRNAYSNAM